MKLWTKLSGGAKAAVVIMIPTLVLAIYIMARGLGLQESLDFGAGAYFYADIPNFERFTVPDFYHSPVSMWMLIILFLIWGAIMWKAWLWLDQKMTSEEETRAQTK